MTGGGNVVTGGDGRGLPLSPVTSRHFPSPPVTSVASWHHLTSSRHFPYVGRWGGEEVTGVVMW